MHRVDSRYISELYVQQVELLKLQKYISEQGLRLAILFEGRDTAGKGRAISRFTQFLNPQLYRMVALGKPSEQEKGQWYFQRYTELPRCMHRGSSFRIKRVVQHNLLKDQFNETNLQFPQEKRKIKNWYSVNIQSQNG